jgi:putative ABC transport system ATP-binding protein
VAVARALANQPKLVLADEPTGNLDRRLARESLGLIREVCRENRAALLLVSHDQDALSQFNRVISLGAVNRALSPGTINKNAIGFSAIGGAARAGVASSAQSRQ